MMNIFSGCDNNGYLWILIALAVLGASSNGCSGGGIFSGCGIPVLLALVYCMTKNGTLPSLLSGGNSCGCGCGNN